MRREHREEYRVQSTEYRVLILAILFSAVWHLFWLSAFTVVIVPKTAKPVKFSGVSFLGPILDRGALSVSVAPRQRSPLEERYLTEIEKPPLITMGGCAQDRFVEAGLGESDLNTSNAGFIGLAIAAIDTDKMEPPRSID